MAPGTGVEELADESTLAPPITREQGSEKERVPANVLDGYVFPVPEFAKARLDSQKRLMPQVISHRGYKAKFPENSLLAFREVIKVGATALETDIHLTKDDVVVLSHDRDLRKFGTSKKILDCTWDEIKHMKTLAEPHVPMLRLADLLDYLRQPSQRDIWLLLDVKSDNQAKNAMQMIASTIAKVQPLPNKPWSQRILLGLWAKEFIPLAANFLPGFSVVHVGFHLSHARRNLGASNVGSNMLVQTLLAPGGRRFLQECRGRSGPNIAWTVNDPDQARWCARRGLDGIITDDPVSLLRSFERYDENAQEPMVPMSAWACFDVFVIFVLVNSLFWYFRRSMNLDGSNARKASN